MEERQANGEESFRDIFGGQPKMFYVLLAGMALVVCSLPTVFIDKPIGKWVFIIGMFTMWLAMAVMLYPRKGDRDEQEDDT